VDINQVYRAPSIPKLGKKTVSSSVLRGAAATTAAAPKLGKTRFSFLKPKISAENLKTDVSSVSVEQSLVETNRILVEIQKQLALDFANRIAEEKELIKGIKKAESRRKFGAKEKFVESTKKIGSAIGGAVSKITSPVKTVFERIVDFFKAILTGIVLNAAFKWLEDPANKAKLFAVFDFIGKYWKELVITFIGVKVLGFISKLIGLGRLIGKFFGKGGPGGGLGNPCQSLLQCMGNPAFSKAFVAASISAFLANKAFNDRIEDIVKGLLPPQTVPAPALNPQQQRRREDIESFREQFTPGGYSAENVRAQQEKFKENYPDVDWGAVADWGMLGVSVAFTGDTVAADVLAVANLLKNGRITVTALRGIIGPKATKGILDYMRTNNMTPAVAKAKGGTIPELPKKKKCDMCSLGFSMGGTVPGKGSGVVDSVRAFLAPGEEVIRTASAMMFRPLLKDINDNAGRLWNTFSQAVTTLISVSAKQKEVSENFDSVTTEFSRYLQDETRKQKFGTGGGTKVSSSPKKPNISSTPKVINLINQGVPVGKGGVNVFSLPPTKSKPPEIPQIQTSEKKVPVISPIDFTNPWMDITPEWYGIQLYG